VIILDTNVVSEPMKPDGDRGVQDWLDEQNAETLYLTSISLSEQGWWGAARYSVSKLTLDDTSQATSSAGSNSLQLPLVEKSGGLKQAPSRNGAAAQQQRSAR